MPDFKLSAESEIYKLTGHDAQLRVFSPFPKNHPAYALIGRVAAEWAQLEHILDRIIWELAYLDDETGACIIAQIIGPRPRFGIIMSLVEKNNVPKSTIKRLNDLSRRMFEIYEERNRIVHDAWYDEGHGKGVAQFKSPRHRDSRLGYHSIKESYIKETIETIKGRVADLKQLRQTFLQHMRAPSRERREA